MKIIDHTDFEGRYILALDTEEKQWLLDEYCLDIQEKYLKKLMGETLYSEFAVLTSIAGTKFDILINGTTTPITYNSNTFIYTGVKKMLVLFTYFYFIQEPDYNTLIGQVQGQAENSTPAINVRRLVNTHNEAVRLYDEAIIYMDYWDSINTGTNIMDPETETIREINLYGI